MVSSELKKKHLGMKMVRNYILGVYIGAQNNKNFIDTTKVIK